MALQPADSIWLITATMGVECGARGFGFQWKFQSALSAMLIISTIQWQFFDELSAGRKKFGWRQTYILDFRRTGAAGIGW